MNDINFVKNIDNLGRIVIPMDIRRKLQINTGDVLSITCNDKDILLTKYSSLNSNAKIIDIIKVMVELFSLKVILMDRESVIYSNIVSNVKLSNDIKIMMKNNIKNQMGVLKFQDIVIEDMYSMMPIITNDGVIGGIICIGSDEIQYKMCELISKLVNIELNIT